MNLHDLKKRPPHIAILGAQWGDEGKGKIVDMLAPHCAAVCRFQGGNNAGHTLWVDGKKIVLHQIPSGILRDGCISMIGQGAVLSLATLTEEMAFFRTHGLANVADRLRLDAACTLILPSHCALDTCREEQLGTHAIGTTRRGIGPAYEDTMARTALRLGDLQAPHVAQERLTAQLDAHNFLLAHRYQQPPFDAQQVLDDLLQAYAQVRPCVADVGAELLALAQAGGRILFEGAQGALLDLRSGGWPYVTSSNTRATSVSLGAGVPYDFLGVAIGVAKCYQTRVGAGPFPTEMAPEAAQHLRQRGGEFGATTGRDRRCGWLDLVALKRVVARDGLNALALSKIDVLDTYEEIKVAVAYDTGMYGVAHTASGPQPAVTYKTLPGWRTNTSRLRDGDKIPAKLRDFVELIEQEVGVPVIFLCDGPDRDAWLWSNEDWKQWLCGE